MRSCDFHSLPGVGALHFKPLKGNQMQQGRICAGKHGGAVSARYRVFIASWPLTDDHGFPLGYCRKCKLEMEGIWEQARAGEWSEEAVAA